MKPRRSETSPELDKAPAPVSVDEALAAVARWQASGMPLFGLHRLAIVLADEVENLRADAANDAGDKQSFRRSIAELCEAIGVERGDDHWQEFMGRVREHMDSLVGEASAQTGER